jgi:hypothetical protein
MEEKYSKEMEITKKSRKVRNENFNKSNKKHSQWTRSSRRNSRDGGLDQRDITCR